MLGLLGSRSHELTVCGDYGFQRGFDDWDRVNIRVFAVTDYGRGRHARLRGKRTGRCTGKDAFFVIASFQADATCVQHLHVHATIG